ncbi:hypothetical protein GA0070616_4334 [Micromonospora nigra]|uniref:Uncharacterized protein n=1 Tax=Micromonospora nigra TaxID=145857 RepID=A0A1C6SR69_9ACTN|nr:hypothetical protein [Micromonospora nigra]SCL31799.1 hypothetical protein GA0070616_4334 [Micromonospora nigra]
MTVHRGTTSDIEEDREPAGSNGAAQTVFIIIGTIAATGAGVACLFDSTTHIDLPHGLYAILGAALGIGGCGWTTCHVADRAEARVHRDLGVTVHQVREDLAATNRRLAELTSFLESHVRSASRTYSPPHRATGHMYASASSQGATVGILATTVDAATDPAVAAVRRAREDGIEQGFEIGYQARLADVGVTPLGPARARRLTGDS